MRIAFLTFEYVSEPTFDGGLANYLRRISLALIKRGHQVEIFTQSTTDETIEHDGLLVHRIKPPEKTVNWIRRVTRYYYSHDAMMVLPFALKIRRQVLHRHRQAPFDVIQSANLQSLGLGLVHFSPIPLIVRASSYQPYWRQYDRVEAYHPSRSTQLIDRIERYMVRHATASYAPSRLIAEAFYEHANVAMDVIPTLFSVNTVTPDATFFNETLGTYKYLLYFGTIKVLKGGLVLGEALKILLPQFPDLHFVFVGKDTQIKDSQPQATVMQYIMNQVGPYSDQIHHIERLRHEQLYPIIRGAAGVVLPSRIDNFPNTCLEAMGMGKVVIGTQGASFEEIIDNGVSGILVPKDDAVALAQAMEQLWLMSDDEKNRIGQAALSKIHTLEPDIVCQILEAYFLKHMKPR